MKTKRAMAVAAALWAASQGGLLAQGCAMCKSSIAAQTDAVISSINAGILILLGPPLLILATIVFVAVRLRE